MIEGSFTYYPPAETAVPFAAMFKAFLPGNGEFEGVLCRHLGVGRVITASSARGLLALLLLELKKRADKRKVEVLIPGYTCYSVASSIVRAGLKVRVYDLDPKTLNPDIDSFCRASGDTTLAVVVQHLFGIPGRIDEVIDYARKAHTPLIEDAAQALGGTCRKGLLGTQTDFGLFSFGRGKPLPLGTGGVLVSRDSDILSQIQVGKSVEGYVQPFVTFATRLLSHKKVYGILEALPLGLGKTVFDPGFDISPMSRMAKKMGSAAFDHLKLLNMHRRAVAGVYSSVLPNELIYPISETDIPVFTRFPVRLRIKYIPKDLIRLGVRRMYPRAISDEPAIRGCLAKEDMHTPGSKEIAENLFTLPTHLGITSAHAGLISEKILGLHA